MTAIVWADVQGVDATLVAVDLSYQVVLLDVANSTINVDAFGGEEAPKTRMVRILFAAHFAALSLQATGKWTGAVIAESALGLSRSYASNSPMGTSPLWDKTQHGQAMRAIIMSTYRSRGPMVC